MFTKWCITLFLLFVCFNGKAQVLRKRVTLLMGGRFEITIVAKDAATAEQNIDTCIAEISRIENLISDWKATSQVSEINRNAGLHAMQVNSEVFNLTKRALKLSKITNGAFDISFAAMEKIWKFDGSMTLVPSPQAIKKSVAKVSYNNIILDSINSTVFLKLPGMKIGFGALGEGYAADRCRDLMVSRGITAGIINGTGDMRSWGKQPDGSYWKVGVINPFDDSKIFAQLTLRENAVVTSGSYEKYVIINGKRYAHIINPKTGYPAAGLISVTIVGPSAEIANGYSTSVMVLGKTTGLKFLARHPAYKYIIITERGDVIASKSLGIKQKKIGS